MLSILKSALNANTKEMGIVSNNIANANSTGFKKSSTNFEHIYSTHNSTDPDKFSGQGVNISDPRLQMSQGALQVTGGALDLAVTGLGFFPVVQGNQIDKPYFTRDGSFNIKANGEVVTNDGLSVMGFMGDNKGILKNLVIPTTKENTDESISIISNINVSSNGKITAIYGLDQEVDIGNFVLASFVNDPGLQPVGNNRFQNNAKSGLPKFGVPMDGAFGKLEAGNLERANVDITSEMVTMLKTQQAFSGVSRLLQTEALILSPEDYLQGDAVRIMYVHVPSAWISIGIFSLIATLSIMVIVFKNKIFLLFAKSLAPSGFIFSLVALVTGSIWGKPTWGTWWAWDARITSMLILSIFYLMYLIAWRIFENKDYVTKVTSFIAILGFINIPIIKFSVDWWSTLHQPSSVNLFSETTIHTTMLIPLGIMTAAFALFSLLIFLMKYNTELIKIKNKGLDRL